MAKKVVTQIKLHVTGGESNPSPPVGPALGQHGVNIMEFCRKFNERTQAEKGITVPVVITVYSDRSFEFVTKTPPASVLLKMAAGVVKGAHDPKREKVGRLTRAQVEEIAKRKMPDLTAASLAAAVNSIMGTARSMGIEVTG